MTKNTEFNSIEIIKKWLDTNDIKEKDELSIKNNFNSTEININIDGLLLKIETSQDILMNSSFAQTEHVSDTEFPYIKQIKHSQPDELFNYILDLIDKN